MSSRTTFLSRLIGLYLIIFALSMLARKASFLETVTAMVQDAALMYVLGVLALAAGLALILAHNRWSGGATAVVVTVIGWLTLAKGLLFLFLSPAREASFLIEDMHYHDLFYLYAAIALVIGLYLTYAGFRRRSPA